MSPSPQARGVLYLLGGVFLFAWMDCTTKYLTALYPPPLVVAVRYVVHCALMVAVLAPSRGMGFASTNRTGLVLVRAASLAATSLFVTLAFRRMPVAEASAIIFVSPLLVMLLAGIVLQEKIGAPGWLGALAGFGGVLLIARPGSGLDGMGVAFALAAAVVTALYQLLSRLLASTETTVAMLFYTSLVGATVFGAMAPWFWVGARPSAWQTVLFLSTGALGCVGHFLYTAAHRYAPASALAPLQYVQLLWACLFGWRVFGHVPDRLSLLGMGIVAAAGALAAVRSRMAARALERASEA